MGIDKGSVVRFKYSGGSLPGKRSGYVISATPSLLRIYDFDRKAERQFSRSNISNLEDLTATSKVVDLQGLPITTSVVNALTNLGLETHTFDDKVVGVPVRAIMVRSGDVLVIRGNGGKLELHLGQRMAAYENGGGIHFDPSDPLPIFEALKRVLK